MPKLPTDNLYKFMAIFGVVVVASGLYLSILITNQNQEEIFSFLEKAELLKIEIDQLRGEINSGKINNVDIRNELKRKEISLEIIHNRSEFVKLRIDLSRIILYGSILLGMSLIFYGFWLWYSRLQYYQDKIIKAENGNTEIKNRERIDVIIGLVVLLITIWVFTNYYK